MRSDQLALVQGWPHTRATLRRFSAAPARLLAAWAVGSLAVTALLLAATWYVAENALPDVTRYSYPGLTRPATTEDFLFVLRRNGTVLALHALACVAGFMAGWVRPGEEQSRTQKHAAPLAIIFVTAATLFSLL